MLHKNKMGSIIGTSGTVFYSLLYFNARLGYNELKYSYSVISVIDNSLPGNTKKEGIAPFVDDQRAISRILGGIVYMRKRHSDRMDRIHEKKTLR